MGDYPDVNDLPLGSTWYTRNRYKPERQAILRGLRTGYVPRGRRRRAFAVIEEPPGSITEWLLDTFLDEWYRP